MKLNTNRFERKMFSFESNTVLVFVGLYFLTSPYSLFQYQFLWKRQVVLLVSYLAGCLVGLLVRWLLPNLWPNVKLLVVILGVSLASILSSSVTEWLISIDMITRRSTVRFIHLIHVFTHAFLALDAVLIMASPKSWTASLWIEQVLHSFLYVFVCSLPILSDFICRGILSRLL